MSKLKLRSVSPKKRKFIQEALMLWDKSRKSAHQQANFIERMTNAGWVNKNAEYGAHKECFWKGMVAIKFARNNAAQSILEIQREWEQAKVAPKELKKYFPKSYIYKEGFLIQDRVLLKCNQVASCDSYDVANRFQLYDADHNHGHNLAGNLKFFDWVYYRTGKYLDTANSNIKLGG